jgi:hypothetical protein
MSDSDIRTALLAIPGFTEDPSPRDIFDWSATHPKTSIAIGQYAAHTEWPGAWSVDGTLGRTLLHALTDCLHRAHRPMRDKLDEALTSRALHHCVLGEALKHRDQMAVLAAVADVAVHLHPAPLTLDCLRSLRWKVEGEDEKIKAVAPTTQPLFVRYDQDQQMWLVCKEPSDARTFISLIATGWTCAEALDRAKPHVIIAIDRQLITEAVNLLRQQGI